MGKPFSQLVTDEPNETVKINLLQLEKEVHDRRECQRARLYIDALNDECIPILCAVDKFYDFLGDLSDQTPATVLREELERIIQKHLRTTGATGSASSFVTLIQLLLEVVKAVLQSKTSRHEERQTHVVYANNNFIRIDYFLYSQKLDGGKHALSYYMQVGLIDVRRVRWPVLLYELRRATEDGKLPDAVKELEALERLSDLRLDSAKDALAYLKNVIPQPTTTSSPAGAGVIL